VKRRNFIISLFASVAAVPFVKLMGIGSTAGFGHYTSAHEITFLIGKGAITEWQPEKIG